MLIKQNYLTWLVIILTIFDNIPFPMPFHGCAKRKCGFFPQHNGNRVNCHCCFVLVGLKKENNINNTTHTHLFNGPLSGTTQVSRYQKGTINLDFTKARDIEWQWHQLGHMQVCTLLQLDNHASTPLLSFLQAGCLSWRPTNSVKALKA